MVKLLCHWRFFYKIACKIFKISLFKMIRNRFRINSKHPTARVFFIQDLEDFEFKMSKVLLLILKYKFFSHFIRN